MAEFIVKYWVEELFAIIIAVMTWLVKQMRAKKKEYGTINQAIMALLHDRLYKACSFLIEKGYCTLEDRQNLEYLYAPYKALGGNGTVESLYHKCMELPLSDAAAGRRDHERSDY